MASGGCHCGAIRYETEGEPVYSAVCHCADCRRQGGAPMVSWAAFPIERVTITGTPVDYRSSEDGHRQFCATCGTGLFYLNAKMLPGMIDIRSSTLDDPEALSPQIHVQVAERLTWTEHLETLPKFERYPG